MARIDATRGIWKAPAGLRGRDRRRQRASRRRTDDNVSGQLNPKGVNVLRALPGRRHRRLGRAHAQGRRHRRRRSSSTSRSGGSPTTSRARSTSARSSRSSSPTTPDLWAQLRLAVGTFMRGLFRQGAFQQSEKRDRVGQLLRRLRRDGQPAVRDRPRPGQRRRRLRAAQAGRVRRHHDHPDLAAGGMTMAQFTVNATRFDPYKSFMFRVKWDGQYVAGLSKMSALKRIHRSGRPPRGRRSVPRAQEPRQDEVRRSHARARRHATTPRSRRGRTSSTRSRARSR